MQAFQLAQCPKYVARASAVTKTWRDSFAITAALFQKTRGQSSRLPTWHSQKMYNAAFSWYLSAAIA